ncbi:hypothetical protein [Sphingopyxis sp. 550A]
MGILNMLGLMRVEDHKRIVAKQDAVIDKAAGHVAAEEFSGVVGLPNKVALAVQRLKEARDSQFKNRQRYLTAEDRVTSLRREVEEWQGKFNAAVKDLEAQSVELAGFRAKRDRDNAGRRERRARNATGAQKSGPARTKKGAA